MAVRLPISSSDLIKLFFDASVLIAGAHSPTGGSGYLLEACRRGRFKPVVTRLVLIEAERNIKAKLGEEDLLRFYQLLGAVDFVVEPPVSAREIADYSHLIEEKDAHVLAAAVVSGAQFLLTLDTKHFMTERLSKADLGLTVVTPGHFIREHLDV
jgi:predicted nucleic acid-binding protein